MSLTTKPARRHLAEYLTGLMVAERKNISAINRQFAVTTDRRHHGSISIQGLLSTLSPTSKSGQSTSQIDSSNIYNFWPDQYQNETERGNDDTVIELPDAPTVEDFDELALPRSAQ